MHTDEQLYTRQRSFRAMPAPSAVRTRLPRSFRDGLPFAGLSIAYRGKRSWGFWALTSALQLQKREGLGRTVAEGSPRLDHRATKCLCEAYATSSDIVEFGKRCRQAVKNHPHNNPSHHSPLHIHTHTYATLRQLNLSSRRPAGLSSRVFTTRACMKCLRTLSRLGQC